MVFFINNLRLHLHRQHNLRDIIQKNFNHDNDAPSPQNGSNHTLRSSSTYSCDTPPSSFKPPRPCLLRDSNTFPLHLAFLPVAILQSPVAWSGATMLQSPTRGSHFPQDALAIATATAHRWWGYGRRGGKGQQRHGGTRSRPGALRDSDRKEYYVMEWGCINISW